VGGGGVVGWREGGGLWGGRSSTVKAGASLMRSPLTVVMVCPGGFGRAPGPPSDALAASDAGAPCDAGGTTDGADVGGRDAAATRRRGAAGWGRARGAVAGFCRGAATSTSGTPTPPAARARG